MRSVENNEQKCSKASINILGQALSWWRTIGKSPNTISLTEIYVTQFLVENDMEKKHPSEIDEHMVNDWVNDKSDRKRATRKVRLARVRVFLKYCQQKGIIPYNPADLVQVNMRIMNHKQKETKQKQVFSQEELGYLSLVTDNMWASFINISVETGLRLGDVLQLEWDCWDGKNLTVWTDKKDKRVSINASDRLKRLMKTRYAETATDSPYIFPEDRDKYLRNGSQYYSTTFKRMCVQSGLDDRCFHGLRATYATNQKRQGRSSQSIANDLGHSNKKLTEEVYIK